MGPMSERSSGVGETRGRRPELALSAVRPNHWGLH
jgi:hypothetical protein